MTPVHARRLAWGLAALAMALLIGGYVLAVMASALVNTVTELSFAACSSAFAIVGALVGSRHSRNAIGWVCLGVAVFMALGHMAYGVVSFRLSIDAEPGAFYGAAAAYADVA